MVKRALDRERTALIGHCDYAERRQARVAQQFGDNVCNFVVRIGLVITNLDPAGGEHGGECVTAVVVFVGDSIGLHVAVLPRHWENDRAAGVEDHFGGEMGG